MPSKKTTSSPKTSRKKTATKKAVAKKASVKPAKKAVAKKSTSRKQTTAKVLVCAGPDACFWTTDGAILKDLQELRDALQIMTDSVFSYHVQKEKNDFAEWVEFVLKDPACAEALRKARKPSTARIAVERHLRLYIS